jgi:hypothetical protein
LASDSCSSLDFGLLKDLKARRAGHALEALTNCIGETFACHRWRKECGGLKLDQAKQLSELVKENKKPKRLVAELSLEKQVVKDVAEGNF